MMAGEQRSSPALPSVAEFTAALLDLDRGGRRRSGARRLRATYQYFASTYEGGEILDIGNTSNDFSVCLKRLGYEVCASRQHPLPFDDGRFAFALLTGVVEHPAVDPLAVFHDIRRVLATDGRLLIATPHVSSRAHQKSFGFGRPLPPLESSELAELLALAGFDTVSGMVVACDKGMWYATFATAAETRSW